MRRRLLERLAVALVVALVGTSCGVPSDGSPSPVADDDLPAALRNDATSTTAAPTQAETATKIYLIQRDRLVGVVDRADGSDLNDSLALLQRGPTTAQARSGMRSAFTDAELIRNASLAGRTAMIDLDPSFAEVPHQDQILALGQIVMTAVSHPGIASVRFTLDGDPTGVPTGDGTLTRAALVAGDYESLVRR